jgi:hypothetical protein
MTQFLISYIGGDQPSSPEEGQAHRAKWQQWLEDLGSAIVSPANPMMHTQTVNPDGSVTTGGSSRMSGYTIVEADSMDAALEMAKSCPFLDINGSLEVSELMQMPG